MTIGPATIDKLGKLFPRLASDQDGEVIATARAIIRVLEGAGSSLHGIADELRQDVQIVERVVYRDRPAPRKSKAKKVEPQPSPTSDRVRVLWIDVVRWVPHLVEDCNLNERETAFVQQIHDWAKAHKNKFTLTTKQASWWARILLENDINTTEHSS